MSRRFFNAEECDFIVFSGGREFIRKFEVVGMRWCQYCADDMSLQWRLNVFLSDCPSLIVYGEDAAAFLGAFGLPEGPPDE